MKEESQKKILAVTALLSMTAGYADTVTFISANRLLSAHITGNFVVFVYNLVTGARHTTWLNLLAFPLMIAAISVGSYIGRHARYSVKLLKIEGIILFLTGVIAAILKLTSTENTQTTFMLGMCTVVAMGFQNAFGKIYPKAVYAPTTIMTGNVTQITVDFTRYFINKVKSKEIIRSFKQQTVIIGGFFIGCLLGGVFSYFHGMPVVILPGILLMFYFWNDHDQIKPN
jgi:uncharacterized membrane protein YoaK (UPF0700 family)